MGRQEGKEVDGNRDRKVVVGETGKMGMGSTSGGGGREGKGCERCCDRKGRSREGIKEMGPWEHKRWHSGVGREGIQDVEESYRDAGVRGRGRGNDGGVGEKR